MVQRRDPIIVPAEAESSDVKKSAAIVFMHGLGDMAETFESIALQFNNAKKLPYLQWVIPNATENRDAMTTAWYLPTGLSPFPSSRPELDDPEDEDGMMVSRKYIVSLIDDLIEKGVPPNRIVLAGFSQGCAMTLVTGLTSKYAGKLGGLACICGYFPLADRINKLREEAGLEQQIGDVPILVQRGSRDMLIPRRFHSMMVDKLTAMGAKDEILEVREYEGSGHEVNGPTLKDLCTWLEKVIPPL